MTSIATKMTQEKYMADDWPDMMDWLSLESDIRTVLRDHFAGGAGIVNEHLAHIDRLLEFYTGRGSERRLQALRVYAAAAAATYGPRHETSDD